MAKHAQYFSFRPNSRVTPENETAAAFIKSFGSKGQLVAILAFAGLPTTLNTIRGWANSGSLPEQAYRALKGLREDGLRGSVHADAEEIGGLEVFFKGVFIGRFDLPRGINVVAKKRGFSL